MPDGYTMATRRMPALAEPFATAEEAWFWTSAALTARRDGARNIAGMASTLRPCEPDDVVRVLNRLYYQRRIDLIHARVLRIWGERGVPPDPQALGEMSDARIWDEAMRRLAWPLQAKGIVVSDPRSVLTGRD